jgi:hypothetical protein
MADVVNVGSAPNDGTGINYRDAWIAINAAFSSDRDKMTALAALIQTGVSQSDLDQAISGLQSVFDTKLNTNGDASALTVTQPGGAPQTIPAALALASSSDAQAGTATTGLMTPALTTTQIAASVTGTAAGTVGQALALKAGLSGPLVTFNRTQPNSVDALLRDLVWQQGRSVIEFGAQMNRSSSDDAALDAAIAALPDQGGVILVPPFDLARGLLLNSPHTFTKPNVAIVGAGVNQSNILTTTGHNFDVFATGAYGPTLAGFTWTVYGTTGVTPAYLLNATASPEVRLLDIGVAGAPHSIANLAASNSRAERLRVKSLKPLYGIGLRYSGTIGEAQRIINCDFENPAGQDCFAGIYIASGSCFEIIGTQLIKMGTPIYAQTAAGASIFSIVLVDTWCDTSSNIGMILDGTNGTITRVKATGSWFSSCTRGIEIRGNVWGAHIGDGCEVYDNLSDGIRVYSGATLKGLSIDGASIAGNGIRAGGNAATGVNVLGSTGDFDIRNTNFGPAADFGVNTYSDINFGTGVDNYSIVANRFARADGRPQVVGHTAATTRIAADNRGWSP